MPAAAPSEGLSAGDLSPRLAGVQAEWESSQGLLLLLKEKLDLQERVCAAQLELQRLEQAVSGREDCLQGAPKADSAADEARLRSQLASCEVSRSRYQCSSWQEPPVPEKYQQQVFKRRFWLLLSYRAVS